MLPRIEVTYYSEMCLSEQFLLCVTWSHDVNLALNENGQCICMLCSRQCVINSTNITFVFITDKHRS